MALTPKQQKFVEEYLVDLNATQAAIRAGYSETSAGTIGNDNLQKQQIVDAIAKQRAKQSKRTELNADYVITGFLEVAERCLQRAPVLQKVGNGFQQKIDGEDNNVWQFNAPGANKALEMIGKHLGMFTDKIDINMNLDISGHVTLDAAHNAIGNLTGYTGPKMLPPPDEIPKKVANG